MMYEATSTGLWFYPNPLNKLIVQPAGQAEVQRGRIAYAVPARVAGRGQAKPTGCRASKSAAQLAASAPTAALLWRRMFERELGISLFVDLDHECHSSFGAAKRKRLSCVLVRDRVHVPEIAIRTALDHSATKLGFLVGVVKINDGERDTRIASNVLCLKRAFPGADQDVVLFATYPNGDALRRAVGHQGGEMGKVGAIEQRFDFIGKC